MYNPQLDTFIRVAEAGSFSKAAQESFITPTAVIKQMNLLESRLGLTLFHRSHQGLSLTRAGRSLLADARHIVQYSQESIARARVAERGEKRIIRVGVSLMTPSTPLTKLWPKVKERCPGMSLQVVTFENTPSAARGLANLGQDMDIVVGISTMPFLKSAGAWASSFRASRSGAPFPSTANSPNATSSHSTTSTITVLCLYAGAGTPKSTACATRYSCIILKSRS